MGANCCHEVKFEGMDPRYKRALILVILINAIMFLVEMPMGFVGNSQALKADALDFFGDTCTYALSLYVIGKAGTLRAKAALLKGLSLSAMGLWVLGSTLYTVLYLNQPQALSWDRLARRRSRPMWQACCCSYASRTATPMCARSGSAAVMTPLATSW
nr:cation transporter [Kordiimonas gwangyangensis]